MNRDRHPAPVAVRKRGVAGSPNNGPPAASNRLAF